MRPKLLHPWLPSIMALATPSLAAEWPDISQPLASEGGGSQDAAVVVGIEDYWRLTDIPGARESAAAWYQWLVKTRGVPVGRTKLLRDAEVTRSELLSVAQAASERVGQGGTLWFVYIGHGAPSRTSRPSVAEEKTPR